MKNRPRQLLQFYSKFRGTKPTVIQAFARQPILYWVSQIFLFVIVGVLYYFTKDKFALTLFAGVLIGGLLRDVGWMLSFRRNWPTLDGVLDWQRIEQELTKEPSADS